MYNGGKIIDIKQQRLDAFKAENSRFDKNNERGIVRNSQLKTLHKMNNEIHEHGYAGEQAEQLYQITLIKLSQANYSQLTDKGLIEQIQITQSGFVKEVEEKFQIKFDQISFPDRSSSYAMDIKYSPMNKFETENIDRTDEFADAVDNYFKQMDNFNVLSDVGELTLETVTTTYGALLHAFTIDVIEKKQFKEDVRRLIENKNVQDDKILSSYAAQLPYDMTRNMFDKLVAKKLKRDQKVDVQTIKEFDAAMNFMIESEVQDTLPLDQRHKKRALKILKAVDVKDKHTGRLRDEVLEKYHQLMDPDAQKQEAYRKVKTVKDFQNFAGKYIETGGEPEIVKSLSPEAGSAEVTHFYASLQNNFSKGNLSPQQALDMMQGVSATFFKDPNSQQAKQLAMNNPLNRELYENLVNIADPVYGSVKKQFSAKKQDLK